MLSKEVLVKSSALVAAEATQLLLKVKVKNPLVFNALAAYTQGFGVRELGW